MKYRYIDFFKDGFIPREQQIEGLNWLDERLFKPDTPKCKVIEGPVAVGKSFLSMAVAKAEAHKGKKVSIVTATRMLQDQYTRDFPEIPVLKGAANYDCNCFPGNTCADTRQRFTAFGMKPPCEIDCPYIQAKHQCLDAPIAIFNTMSYLYFPKTEETETGKHKYITDLLIVDEFQTVAGMLMNMFELTLWGDEIKIQPGVSGSQVAVVALLNKRISALRLLVTQSKTDSKELVKVVQHLAKLQMVVNAFEQHPEEYVVEETELFRHKKPVKCLRIRIIRPSKQILNWFFKTRQVLLMSATAFDIDVKELGFKEFDKLNLSSPIPVERRRFYAESIVKNSFSNQEMAIPLIAKRIKEIVSARPKERGVVLCTYRQMELLKEHLTDDFYLFHGKQDRQEVINKFIDNLKTRYVGVFAASFEGLDLKDDIARFVILCILPLPSYVDAVVQKRIEMDKHGDKQNWYEMQALKQVVQGAGRASRNETDFSTIHMLDMKFNAAYAKCKNQLPQVFRETIKWGRG